MSRRFQVDMARNHGFLGKMMHRWWGFHMFFAVQWLESSVGSVKNYAIGPKNIGF